MVRMDHCREKENVKHLQRKKVTQRTDRCMFRHIHNVLFYSHIKRTKIIEQGQNLHVDTAQAAVVAGQPAEVGHGLHGLGRRDARLQLEGEVVEVLAGLGIADLVEDGRDGVVRFGRVVEGGEGGVLDDGAGIDDEGMVPRRLLLLVHCRGGGGDRRRRRWFLFAGSILGGLGRRRTRPAASESAHRCGLAIVECASAEPLELEGGTSIALLPAFELSPSSISWSSRFGWWPFRLSVHPAGPVKSFAAKGRNSRKDIAQTSGERERAK